MPEYFKAFYDTDVDRERIPAGFVPYSNAELLELFQEDSSG